MSHQSLENPEAKLLKELESLQDSLSGEPGDWELRKRVVQSLHNLGRFAEAADTIWSAPEIPPVDLEIGFSIRSLAKGRPRKALRLCHAVLEQNQGKPVKNLAIGNALLHHGMVMLAARFYGAAYAEEPGYGDPEFEFWLLYVDDSQSLWGDWEDKEQVFEELPWMRRDKELIEKLSQTAAFKLTTPIKLPTLPASSSESLEDINHVRHSNKENAGPLAPPSIQFTPDAVASLGENVEIPGQRSETDAAPASSEPLPSRGIMGGASGEVETPTAAAQAGGPNTVKLKLPGGQEIPNRKADVSGPAAPQAPSITLPDASEE